MEYDYEIDPRSQGGRPGWVTLPKDDQNMIGISIGGGAPQCPCLYVVQIFDNTLASKDGTLQAGDEITGVNGKSVRGRKRSDVARAIQTSKGSVTIQYVKLYALPEEGNTLDIIMKRIKHKCVERMREGTADALGLSRAILCNDSLVKRLDQLEQNSMIYQGLVVHTKKLLSSFVDMMDIHKELGDIFASIGVRELQKNSREAFSVFAECHRGFCKSGNEFLKVVSQMVRDLNTYLNRAIPDTKLTIKKYLDAKFNYLSYCLKVKELDDEENEYNRLQESLYRVETGNYDYRVVLRCRQLSRETFAKLRSDVEVKLELLGSKHVTSLVYQLQCFVESMTKFHNNCEGDLNNANVFPIEVDICGGAFAEGEHK